MAKIRFSIRDKKLTIVSLLVFVFGVMVFYINDPNSDAAALLRRVVIVSPQFRGPTAIFSPVDQKAQPTQSLGPVPSFQMDKDWQALNPNDFALNENLGQALRLSDVQLISLNHLMGKLKQKSLTILQESKARFDYDDESRLGFLFMPDQEPWAGYESEFDDDLHRILDSDQYMLFRERSRSALEVWTGAFGQRPRYFLVNKSTIDNEDWRFSVSSGPLAYTEDRIGDGTFAIPENYTIESFANSFTLVVPNYKAIGERLQGSFNKSQIPALLTTLLE